MQIILHQYLIVKAIAFKLIVIIFTPMSKTIINTVHAPAPIGPYSQAVIANGMLYISGQIAIDPATGELDMATIKDEATRVMNNLKAILTEAKLNFDHAVKTTILLTDMALFAEVNEIYGSYFSNDAPARETFAVKDLPKGVNIEISMIAIL
jgi:2-iminobutanoate/2-iminopropanoate deaminase